MRLMELEFQSSWKTSQTWTGDEPITQERMSLKCVDKAGIKDEGFLSQDRYKPEADFVFDSGPEWQSTRFAVGYKIDHSSLSSPIPLPDSLHLLSR